MTNQGIIYDMASVAGLMHKFNGTDKEDATVWLRDCKPVARMANLPEQLKSRLMILALEDEAILWASQIIQDDNDLTIKDFETQINTRFSN